MSPLQPGLGSGPGSSGECRHTAQTTGSPPVLDWLPSPPAVTAYLRKQRTGTEPRKGRTQAAIFLMFEIHELPFLVLCLGITPVTL